ncbi:zf-HC2 domain-containing protein [Rossellomorea sp. SC111]|uniref:zf-HC2 domain-containing protein n=1 Tax=Rossellomorea sp. SC111 TaxID=2968985 RepID=UPI00215AB32D|nr:zf-HC2 domain-containing protein [Rossellomorea sp. SC111]MCR8847988.1 zf-HC2 domain-containing protein [Rossellomorea sp. SC111]
MNHHVFKDLVPSYMEHLTSEETNRQMEVHMEQCKNCREYLHDMQEDWLSENEHEQAKEDRNVDYLKKVRSKNRKKILTIVTSLLSLFLILIIGYYLLYIKMWIAEPNDVQTTIQKQGNTVNLTFTSKQDNRYLLLRKEQLNQDYIDNMIVYEMREDLSTPENLMDGINITYTFLDENTLLLNNGKEKKLTADDKISIQYKDSTKELSLMDLYYFDN